MDSKTLNVLEYPKILARLADFCDFSGSADLARLLTPTPDFSEASSPPGGNQRGAQSARHR